MPRYKLSWPSRTCARELQSLGRRFFRASSRRQKDLPPTRKPKSKSGGRSSSRPTSKASDRADLPFRECRVPTRWREHQVSSASGTLNGGELLHARPQAVIGKAFSRLAYLVTDCAMETWY